MTTIQDRAREFVTERMELFDAGLTGNEMADWLAEFAEREKAALVPMDESKHLLACQVEECAEVIKECCKALRFGLGDKVTMNPAGPRGTEGPTNAEKIAGEQCDMFAVAEMLTERGIIPGPWFNAQAVAKKKAKVESYMEYARTVGALQPLPPTPQPTAE